MTLVKMGMLLAIPLTVCCGILAQPKMAAPAPAATTAKTAPAPVTKAVPEAEEAGSMAKAAEGIVEITSQEELDEHVSGGKPVILKVYTTWCGPCKMMLPDYEASAAANPHITYLAFNADKNKEFVKGFGCQGYPTLVVYNGKGKELYKHCGSMDKNGMQMLVEVAEGRRMMMQEQVKMPSQGQKPAPGGAKPAATAPAKPAMSQAMPQQKPAMMPQQPAPMQKAAPMPTQRVRHAAPAAAPQRMVQPAGTCPVGAVRYQDSGGCPKYKKMRRAE